MRFIFISFFIFFSAVNYKSTAQSIAHKNTQEFGLAMYNVGFGGITAGLGAVINKKKGTKNAIAFLRGFKYGCIGGAIDYGAKRIDYFIYHPKIIANTISENEKYLIWGWPTKIIHSIGSSIILNAAQNKEDVFKNYDFKIGFINFNINFEQRLHIKPQLMPLTMASFIYFLANKNFQFKPVLSLKLGSPIFLYDSGITNSYFHDLFGATIFNTIFLNNNLNNINSSNAYRETIAHEHIHELQFNEYTVFNKYFYGGYNKMLNKKIRLKNILNKYFYCDVPYGAIPYFFMSQYYTSSQPYNPYDYSYFKNLYELEAEHFSTNRYIPHHN